MRTWLDCERKFALRRADPLRRAEPQQPVSVAAVGSSHGHSYPPEESAPVEPVSVEPAPVEPVSVLSPPPPRSSFVSMSICGCMGSSPSSLPVRDSSLTHPPSSVGGRHSSGARTDPLYAQTSPSVQSDPHRQTSPAEGLHALSETSAANTPSDRQRTGRERFTRLV